MVASPCVIRALLRSVIVWTRIGIKSPAELTELGQDGRFPEPGGVQFLYKGTEAGIDVIKLFLHPCDCIGMRVPSSVANVKQVPIGTSFLMSRHYLGDSLKLVAKSMRWKLGSYACAL